MARGCARNSSSARTWWATRWAEAIALELARAGEAGGATAISPVGLWTGAEAAYALGSLRIARTVARALGPRRSVVAGNPAGRAVAFGQLTSRPWRIPAPMAEELLRGFATAPGFDATVPAVGRYRLRGFDLGVPVTIAWGRRDLLTPPHQAGRARRLLPWARHVALPGCGHSPMIDDSDQIARVVLEASRG